MLDVGPPEGLTFIRIIAPRSALDPLLAGVVGPEGKDSFSLMGNF
ncbi:MAG: hypothetical protein [Bacteriophage sp.]|nr:MAG: hypothetical protein [Bacteriophage sp.]UWI36680.1 MAG: hypothetical protein [Bacteriophage sp.]